MVADGGEGPLLRDLEGRGSKGRYLSIQAASARVRDAADGQEDALHRSPRTPFAPRRPRPLVCCPRASIREAPAQPSGPIEAYILPLLALVLALAGGAAAAEGVAHQWTGGGEKVDVLNFVPAFWWWLHWSAVSLSVLTLGGALAPLARGGLGVRASLLEGAGKVKVLIFDILADTCFYYMDVCLDCAALKLLWDSGEVGLSRLNALAVLASSVHTARLVFVCLQADSRTRGAVFPFTTAATLRLAPLLSALLSLLGFMKSRSVNAFERLLPKSRVPVLVGCCSFSQGLVHALGSLVAQGVALLGGGWNSKQEIILRASVLLSVVSLVKAFTDMDRLGRPVRLLFGRPWVAGSAPVASAPLTAVLLYRAVSVCGRILLITHFHQLSQQVLQPWPGIPCGAPALLSLDLLVQSGLIFVATSGCQKLPWALPSIISPTEPLLHGGGPIFTTYPVIAACAHLVEALLSAAIVVHAQGGSAGVLAAASDYDCEATLVICMVCCCAQLPLLLVVRGAFAYKVAETETWEAFVPAAGAMGVYPAQMDEADFRAPAFFFLCFGGLERIELDGQKIGGTGAKVIASVLAQKTAVKQLFLTDNEIGDLGLEAIAVALEANGTVQRLGLDCNDIGDAGAAAMASALRHNSTVRQVDLIMNRIGDTGAEAIATTLEERDVIQELHLRDNRIGDPGACALAAALKTNSSLRRLSLDFNSIGDAGAEALGGALKVNSSIQQIDLMSNKIGDTGAEAIASALELHEAIQGVYLRENQIGDRGARAVASALRKNTVIQRISLDCNKIGDEGAEAIASSIWQNTVLQHIDLNRNRIKDAGGEAIVSALKQNTTVQRLRVADNDIRSDVLSAIALALEKNNRC